MANCEMRKRAKMADTLVLKKIIVVAEKTMWWSSFQRFQLKVRFCLLMRIARPYVQSFFSNATDCKLLASPDL